MCLKRQKVNELKRKPQRAMHFSSKAMQFYFISAEFRSSLSYIDI